MDLKSIATLYEDGIEKYGLKPKSVGWKDEASHLLRFEKLVEVIDPKEESITVNELGCGYGAMFNFLIKNHFKLVKYFGYDISEKILDAAKGSISDDRTEFIQSDTITQLADYSFESGIFNVRFEVDDVSWKAYIEETLCNLNKYSRVGFGFNLLTTYVDYREPHLYYADPMYFFDFCKKKFSKKVSLLHDYGLFEWTLIVKK